MKLSPAILEDAFVRLEPFTGALKDEVRAALDCDADAWGGMVAAAYGPQFADWWDAALKAMATEGRPVAVTASEFSRRFALGRLALTGRWWE